MFDRNGRWNAANVVDARLVHAVKELPHVRAEGFDVTTLAFSVNCIESETRFTAAAGTRNDRQFAERKIDIDALKIVLARTANLDATHRSQRFSALFFNSL